MNKIDEMQKKFYEMASELEKWKQDMDKQEQEVDFQEISVFTERYPIPSHPLQDCDVYVSKMYLVLLLSVATYDREHIKDSLSLAHRIAFGAGYLKKGKDLRDEWKAAQIINSKQMEEYTSYFCEKELALMLVLEMLLTAGNFKKGKKRALEYIGQLCVLLKVTGEKLTFLSNMAVAILTGDLEQYHCEIPNTYDIFDGYLQRFHFRRKLIQMPKMKKEIKWTEPSIAKDFFGHERKIEKEGEYLLDTVNIKKEKKHIHYTSVYIEKDVIESNLCLIRISSFGEDLTIRDRSTWDIPHECYHTKTHDTRAFDFPLYLFRYSVSACYSTSAKPSGLDTFEKIIGVETHYLDTKKNALKFYKQKGGIVDEGFE